MCDIYTNFVTFWRARTNELYHYSIHIYSSAFCCFVMHHVMCIAIDFPCYNQIKLANQFNFPPFVMCFKLCKHFFTALSCSVWFVHFLLLGSFMNYVYHASQ